MDCCLAWRDWKSVGGPTANLHHPTVPRLAIILPPAGPATTFVATTAREPAEDSSPARASRSECASFADDLLRIDARNHRRGADRRLPRVPDPRHSSVGEETRYPLAIRSAPSAAPVPSEPILFLLLSPSRDSAKG